MKRVARGILRHNLMRNVCLYDVSDRLVDFEERNVFHELESSFSTWERATSKFLKHGFASVAVISSKAFIPPFTCPVASGHHV